MARRPRKDGKFSGLKHARLARDISQQKLADLAKTSKNTIVRLEIGETKRGGMKLTREWAERFAPFLNFSADEILFWDQRRGSRHIESDEVANSVGAVAQPSPARNVIPELVARGGLGAGGVATEEVRRDGRYADPVKPEGWHFPGAFVQQDLRTSAGSLLIIECEGDSMYPTIASGDRLIVNTRHREPSPDGIYALRDTFGGIVVKRLQVLRASTPPRIRIISDNPNHLAEEVGLEEVEIVGRVLWGLKRL
jgi:phage repressor protein C with HTH and peptisase S24 domain